MFSFSLGRPDAYVVHAFSAGQLLANRPVAGPKLSPGKPTKRALAVMESNYLVGKTTCCDRVASAMGGKRAGKAR